MDGQQIRTAKVRTGSSLTDVLESLSGQAQFFTDADGPACQVKQPPMVLNLENMLKSSPCVLALELLRMDADELHEFEMLLDHKETPCVDSANTGAMICRPYLEVAANPMWDVKGHSEHPGHV